MNKRVKLYKNFLLLIFFIILAIIIILNSNAAANGVKNGLQLCSSVIIPSLFPFTVLSVFTLKSGCIYFIGNKLNKITIKLFGLNGAEFSIFIISVFGGYPIGAKLINELYLENKIEIKRAKKLLYCSINAGPSFLIYTIGKIILGSNFLGLILFISNLLVTIIFMLISFKGSKSKNFNNEENSETYCLSDSLVLSVEQTCKMFLNICGWVILFSGFCAVIAAIINIELIKNLAELLFEVTIAVTSAPKIGIPIYFYSFLLSFGGFSTLCQIKSAAKNINPKFFGLILNRVLHGAISTLFTYIFIKIFPQSLETISNGIVTVFNGFQWNFASLFLMVLAVFFIIYVKQ